MDKVHLEISGSLAILTLANPVERPPAALWFRSLPAGVAPLRVLVYEADDRSTQCEFDQPSSLFGRFDNPDVTAVALSLDKKIDKPHSES